MVCRLWLRAIGGVDGGNRRHAALLRVPTTKSYE